MNKIPIPKYTIGDIVFRGYATWARKYITCPDCLGEKKWKVILPSGEEFFVDCNTCKNDGYTPSGKIKDQTYCPEVEKLTIGSVRIDTGNDHPVTYMCKETGIGSGTIHYEENLFSSREEAEKFAIKEVSMHFKTMNERNAKFYKPSYSEKKANKLEKLIGKVIRDLEKDVDRREIIEKIKREYK